MVVSGRHEEAGRVIVRELNELGATTAEFVPADVRYEDQLLSVLSHAMEAP